MCGIAGIISCTGPLDVSDIIRMTDLIQYRGPDDFGYLGYNTGTHEYKPFRHPGEIGDSCNLYFGHRRLSIIDLSETAHQPMSYDNGRYWIVYNGEIYNYIEIRKELEEKQYGFRSSSDTEVVMAAYAEWGTECLKRFNGMFAFSILDTQKNTLFAARDRMGVKPLYYHFNGKFFAFSSEIKQLLSLPWIETRLNHSVFVDYVINYGSYGIEEQTAFSNIHELRGGHSMVIDLSCGSTGPLKLNISQWWDIDPNFKLVGMPDEEYARIYYELFYNACKIRLRSDVPVGTALSGGLDSSGVACMIDKIFRENRISQKQKTFTLSSSHAEFDETSYAREVLAYINADPNFTVADEQRLIDDFDRMIWHQEEPFPSASIYASYSIAKLTKELGVTVSLDGHGADEVLGGYFPYSQMLASELENFHPWRFVKNLTGFHKNQGFSYKSQLRKTGGQLIPYLKTLGHQNGENPLRQFLNADFLNAPLERGNFPKGSVTPIHNRMDHYFYNQVKVYPLPDYLRVADRNTMAFSVESRLPFLDYRLVEFTMSLPNNQKIRNGITKYVYRNAMKDVLPAKIRNRHKKLGFVTPEPVWFKSMIKDLFIETLAQREFPMIFNYGAIERSFSNFIDHNEPYHSTFWKVLYSIKWMKKFRIAV